MQRLSVRKSRCQYRKYVLAARAALTGKHDTLVRRDPAGKGPPTASRQKKISCCQPGALRIHLTRLSTEGLGPRHGEVRRAHQMLNAALLAAVD